MIEFEIPTNFVQDTKRGEYSVVLHEFCFSIAKYEVMSISVPPHPAVQVVGR